MRDIRISRERRSRYDSSEIELIETLIDSKHNRKGCDDRHPFNVLAGCKRCSAIAIVESSITPLRREEVMEYVVKRRVGRLVHV